MPRITPMSLIDLLTRVITGAKETVLNPSTYREALVRTAVTVVMVLVILVTLFALLARPTVIVQRG